MPLSEKLERVIKVIFSKFGLKLKKKKVEIEVVSCSEDEYD